MCKDILTVITGSQLHGLSTPESDTDYRGVFVNDVRDIVNPFEKPPEKRFVEGKTADDTASELRKFVKEIISGSPNAVEILYSNRIVYEGTTVLGIVMRDNREKFIDTAEVFKAYKKYAENQLNKMSLFEPDERTPKFAVAYIRSLLNGIELLRDGTITNPLPELFTLSSGEEIAPLAVLKAIKFCPFAEFGTVQPMATELFSKLQVELGKVFYRQKPKGADTDFIIRFCRRAYNVS